MRRLYIGGLSHAVTQKDLKDRFGKFGEVEDVEVRTRRDDEGVPYKTFSYININISDADFKKCLTVLNKSKWKGGTLQIEMAKESFLHRLAEERQTEAEQRLQPPVVEDKKQKMLDSLSKAGVENFTMKAAVPGTEVPGHKDWVVSKFGRVLPVMQLIGQKGSRARTVKYDPSKYSHNIRKLDRSTEDQHTPVTQLTWEVQGGDDDISKKRRGEFPPFEPSRPKKSRTDMVNSKIAVGRTRLKQTADQTEAHQPTNGHAPSTNHRPAQRTGELFTPSDLESDEEICKMVVARTDSHAALMEEDNLEVVGLDYSVKSGRSHQQQKGDPGDEEENDYDSADTDELFASRKPAPLPQERPTLPTAEPISGNDTGRKRKTTKKKKKAVEEEDDSTDTEHQNEDSSQKQSKKKRKTVLPIIKPPEESENESEDENEDAEGLDSDSDYEAMFSNVTHLEISLADLQKLAEESQQNSENTAPSMPGASSEQEANLTPAERPAPKKGTTPEEILAALMEMDSSDDERKKKKKKKKMVRSTPLPAFQGTRALNEGSETEKRLKEEEEERGGREVKKQKLIIEELQLTHRAADRKNSRTLSKQKHAETDKKTSGSSEEENEEEEEEEVEKKREVVKNKATSNVLKVAPTEAAAKAEKVESVSSSSSSSSSSDDDDDEEEEEEEERVKANQTVLTAKASPSSSSSCAEEDEDKQDIILKDSVKAVPPTAPESESSSSEEGDEEEVEEVKEKQAPIWVPLGAKEEEEQQRKANMRRLAAVQQRQKEAEEHKKLIQGALAKTDTPKPGAGKHIVFGSDDDEDVGDDEDKQQKTSEVTASKKMLLPDSQSEDETTGDDEASVSEKDAMKEKVRPKQSVPQLFSGSEDEEDVAEEEDGSRFDVRPQFEGAAGQKLMELQSRFGTDERFRMDSRFLDDKDEETESKKSVTVEEEVMEEERKKNLFILQSVLSSSQQTCSSNTAGKAKTFRDVSALHYDPSKEEHAVFETKADEAKESKAARKKKREEAMKLPEVSKEIYYDVSGDLKAVFGSTKDEATEGGEMTEWDQKEEEDRGGKDEQPTSSLLSDDHCAEKEDSSGFKFSFFEDATEPEGVEETAEYKVESLKAPKVSWQQDPRFNDSSSEEEEEEGQEKDDEQISIVAKTTEEETPSKTDLFFFYPEDSRLTEGPQLFCCSSQLEEQREQWEETRTALRQEYRKKHKDARRKFKSSQKS